MARNARPWMPAQTKAEEKKCETSFTRADNRGHAWMPGNAIDKATAQQ
jgi:hypothetical protein